MKEQILDGRLVSQELLERLSGEVAWMKNHHHCQPCLSVIRVGDDPASCIYVEAKIRHATALGIRSRPHALPSTTSEKELLQLIDQLNADDSVHGILVQLPLAASIETNRILNHISPAKDVDGLHIQNLGRLYTGEPSLYPCTPLGCYLLLKKYQIPIKGKHVVVLGRSRLVGQPVAHIMLLAGATVTICHIQTPSIREFTQSADIIISAVGKPGLVTADMIQEGVIILDVGITKTEHGIQGDVDFKECVRKASYITPVPGGIGPMTVASLMYNTLIATSLQEGFALQHLPHDPLREELWLS